MAEPRIRLQIFVAPSVVKFVDERARLSGLSRSAVAGAYLEQMTFSDAMDAGLDLALPTIQNVVRDELGRVLDALYGVLARTYLEAGTTHRLVQYHLLNPNEKLAVDEVRRVNATQWQATLKALSERVPELDELMGGARGAEKAE